MTALQPLQLIHFANFHSTNIGNGALVDGLEATIAEDFPVPVAWHREAWDDYTFKIRDFDDAFVNLVNRSDGLIVGGAVTFNGRDYNDRTGTRFELPFELWSELRKPVVFYGLSYRHWPGQTYHHTDKLKETISRILGTPSMLLTVRNDGTREWLRDIIGVDSAEILEVPDSAVFVRPAKGTYPEFVEGARNIMVSVNDEDAAHRYDEACSLPGRSNRARDHVINALVSALERLAERYPVNLVLCPHYFDDFRMISAVIERMKPRLVHQNTAATGLHRVEHVGRFYGRYAKADLAISMRVHSMSPCVGLGTPVVPFTTQARMNDFLDRIGLAGQKVDAFDIDAADQLFTKAVHTLESPDAVKAELARARSELRLQARNFHQRLADFLLNR